MEELLIQAYNEDPSYTRVACKLRKFVKDWRTVKRVVEKHRGKGAMGKILESDKKADITGKHKTRSFEGAHNATVSGALQSNREDYKIMYGCFKEGKTPIDVIAEHGIDPGVVEREFERFSRTNVLRDRDVKRLQGSVIHRFSYELENLGVGDELLSHIDMLFKKRLLTNYELGEFIIEAFKIIKRAIVSGGEG
jgi:hypothetical protein